MSAPEWREKAPWQQKTTNTATMQPVRRKGRWNDGGWTLYYVLGLCKKPGHETGSILLPNKVPIGQRTRLRNFKSFVKITIGKAKFCVKPDIFD
jgi:hypothetical protein